MTHNGKLFLLLFLLLVVVIGCSTGVQLNRSKIQHRGHLVFNGYKNPKVDCYFCHNGDGRGAKMYCYDCHSCAGDDTDTVPDLARRVVMMSDAELRKAIHDGPGFMPRFEKKMTAEEIDQVLQWLRLAFGGTSPSK